MRSARGVLKKKELSAAEVIASNDHLLTELLLRLPVKSLLKSKSVCKHWLSLISDPYFIRSKSRKPNALFFSNGFMRSCELLPLDGSSIRDGLKYLNSSALPLAKKLIQSCNGLLLCRNVFGADKYFVCNPSTKQFKTIPPIGAKKSVLAINLAFDPSISQSYKAVCIHGRKHSRDGCQILIYSSETGHWRVSGDPFTAPFSLEFNIHRGTYWNGAIHWVVWYSSAIHGDSWCSSALYFDVNEEVLKEMALPPLTQDWCHSYFGESGGHLHLVDFCNDLTPQFTVYEMERDRSGWFVKFVVDCNELAGFNPQPYSKPPLNVLCVVRGEKEEDSYLILHSNENGEVIRYNFERRTQRKMARIGTGDPFFYGWMSPTFQYIESLFLL